MTDGIFIDSGERPLPDELSFPLFTGRCVVNTLESVLTEVTGKEVKIRGGIEDQRLSQMVGSMDRYFNKALKRFEVAGIGKDEDNDSFDKTWDISLRLRNAHGRFDKFQIKQLIEGREGSSIIGDLEVRFKSGNLKDIKKYIDEGWSVGVICDVGQVRHMFHIGMDSQNRFVDLSDGKGGSAIVRDEAKLERYIDVDLERTRGWNILVVRPKS